nr:uncharacterized protein CG45076-like [Aegilops tauschii subsp. strangulata]
MGHAHFCQQLFQVDVGRDSEVKRISKVQQFFDTQHEGYVTDEPRLIQDTTQSELDYIAARAMEAQLAEEAGSVGGVEDKVAAAAKEEELARDAETLAQRVKRAKGSAGGQSPADPLSADREDLDTVIEDLAKNAAAEAEKIAAEEAARGAAEDAAQGPAQETAEGLAAAAEAARTQHQTALISQEEDLAKREVDLDAKLCAKDKEGPGRDLTKNLETKKQLRKNEALNFKEHVERERQLQPDPVL